MSGKSGNVSENSGNVLGKSGKVLGKSGKVSRIYVFHATIYGSVIFMYDFMENIYVLVKKMYFLSFIPFFGFWRMISTTYIIGWFFRWGWD
jgi:hypothetical protein